MNKGSLLQQNKPLTRIFLWTSSRSLSTVFVRSVKELPRVKTIFEPHLNVFYHGPGKRSVDSDPRKNLLNDTREFDLQFEAVNQKLLEPAYDKFDAVFIVRFM